MNQGKPSYTAEVVACYRAVESLKPENRRVCYDPFAIHFLRTSFRLVCKLGPLAQPVFWLLAERGFSGDVAQGIARTRYIDDYVKQCLSNGMRQMVILGAGYDSRAYRLEGLKDNVDIKVFEVDHPATQGVKKAILSRLLGALPPHVSYVAIDFGLEALGERLFASGYDKTLKTLFIWEGVTYFLSAEAVDGTLAFVRENSGNGSSIVFDYTFKSVIDGDYDSAEAKKEQEVLAGIGEPYTFGVEEGGIGKFLSARGFCDVAEVSPGFLDNAYFKPGGAKPACGPFFTARPCDGKTAIPGLTGWRLDTGCL